MSDYPEHEKLHQIADESQTIGSFIDFGLPQMGLVIFEQPYRQCPCWSCGRERKNGKWHAKHDEPTEGRWYPTRRSIQTILAEYFDIDQKKIDAEKKQMLSTLREANTREGDG